MIYPNKVNAKINVVQCALQISHIGRGVYIGFIPIVHMEYDSSLYWRLHPIIFLIFPFQTKAAYMLVYQRQDMEAWLKDRTDEPFPFLEPIASPRGTVGSKLDPSLNGDDPQQRLRNGNHQRFSFSGESYISDEDAYNNNIDAMDVSS